MKGIPKLKFPLYLTILASLLSSCIHVYFTEPQRAGGVFLSEMPEELHGSWMLDEDDRMTIESTGLTFMSIRRDTLENIIDTVYEHLFLNDSLELYRSKGYYIVNYREKKTPWEVIIMKKKLNGDIILYESRDPELYAKDKNLKLEEARFDIDEQDSIVHTLNPDFKESLSFRSATFSGQMKLRTVKKIARKENIMNTLKKDGTIQTPNSFEEED